MDSSTSCWARMFHCAPAPPRRAQEVCLDCGGDAARFMQEAVRFANQRCWGTLSCSVFVHPTTQVARGAAAAGHPRGAAVARSAQGCSTALPAPGPMQRAHPQAFDEMVAGLRYGAITVNVSNAAVLRAPPPAAPSQPDSCAPASPSPAPLGPAGARPARLCHNRAGLGRVPRQHAAGAVAGPWVGCLSCPGLSCRSDRAPAPPPHLPYPTPAAGHWQRQLRGAQHAPVRPPPEERPVRTVSVPPPAPLLVAQQPQPGGHRHGGAAVQRAALAAHHAAPRAAGPAGLSVAGGHRP